MKHVITHPYCISYHHEFMMHLLTVASLSKYYLYTTQFSMQKQLGAIKWPHQSWIHSDGLLQRCQIFTARTFLWFYDSLLRWNEPAFGPTILLQPSFLYEYNSEWIKIRPSHIVMIHISLKEMMKVVQDLNVGHPAVLQKHLFC